MLIGRGGSGNDQIQTHEVHAMPVTRGSKFLACAALPFCQPFGELKAGRRPETRLRSGTRLAASALAPNLKRTAIAGLPLTFAGFVVSMKGNLLPAVRRANPRCRRLRAPSGVSFPSWMTGAP